MSVLKISPEQFLALLRKEEARIMFDWDHDQMTLDEWIKEIRLHMEKSYE